MCLPFAYRVSSVTHGLLHCVFLKLQCVLNFTRFHFVCMDLVGSKIQNEKQGSEMWDGLQLASIIKNKT